MRKLLVIFSIISLAVLTVVVYVIVPKLNDPNYKIHKAIHNSDRIIIKTYEIIEYTGMPRIVKPQRTVAEIIHPVDIKQFIEHFKVGEPAMPPVGIPEDQSDAGYAFLFYANNNLIRTLHFSYNFNLVLAEDEGASLYYFTNDCIKYLQKVGLVFWNRNSGDTKPNR